MKPKKSLGQHFLINKSICQQIADYIRSISANQYIEVGPGKGALTDYLIGFAQSRLILVETDQDLIPILNKKYPSIEIIHANFLKMQLDDYTKNSPVAIIGNFPYNISSQIVFKAIDNHSLVSDLVGMFQKEMALRICSPPGSKAYGIISVLTQAFYDCEVLFDVERSNFNPRPNVDSSVIALHKKKDIDPVFLNPKFKEIVKISFAQRRKMLRNTLKPLFGKENLNDDFFNQRPEQLSIFDFANLVKILNKKNNESRTKN